MTDRDLEVADSFERIFPVPTVTAHWDEVLDRAAVHRQGGSRNRLGRMVAVAAMVFVGGLLAAPALGIGDRLLDLVRPERATPEAKTPVWSPDGRRIAFLSIRDGNPEIYVMGRDGSEQKNLTEYPLRDAGPAWSRDGRRIAFERWVDRNPDVFVMNADGSGQVNLTRHRAADTRPAWSPAGERIAFVRRVSFIGQPRVGGPNPHILYRNYLYVVNVDGSGLRKLTVEPVYGHGPAIAPVWSSDGRTIRFWRWIVNADGAGLARIPRAVSPAGAWSPDGRQIAYVRSCHQPSCFRRHGELYVVNTDGSGLRSLARNVASSTPVWSPDGRRIAFRSMRDGNPEIYVIGADGRGLRRVTRHPANERWFSWSPDGKTIAFVRNRDVHVARTNRTGEEQLTRVAS